MRENERARVTKQARDKRRMHERERQRQHARASEKERVRARACAHVREVDTESDVHVCVHSTISNISMYMYLFGVAGQYAQCETAQQ